MKRILIMIFLLLCLVPIVDSAQIQARQSTFTSLNTVWYSYASVALNTRTGESLVYWAKSPPPGISQPPVVARFLNSKGIAASKQFELPGNDQGKAIGYISQMIGYNPITNEFLVAYVGSDESFNVGIYGQRLTAKGTPIGMPTLVIRNTETGWALAVSSVLFNPENGGYTVLFTVQRVNDTVEGSTNMGVVLTNKGIPVGPIKDVLATSFSLIASSYTASGDKLLLAWRNVYHGRDETDFWLQTVDPLLNNIDPSNSGAKMNSVPVQMDHDGFKTIDLGNMVPSNMSFQSMDKGVVYYPDNGNTKGRKINAQGKFSGQSFVAFRKPLLNTKLHSPSAAFTITQKGARGILIGLKGNSQNKSSLWAQVLDEDGKPIGTPVEIYKVSQSEAIVLGGPMYALLSNPTDTVFRFVWFGTVAKKAKFEGYESGRILKLTIDLTDP